MPGAFNRPSGASWRDAARLVLVGGAAVLLSALQPTNAFAQSANRQIVERLLRERLHLPVDKPLRLVVSERPVAAGVLTLYWTGASLCIDCPPIRAAAATIGDSVYALDDLSGLAALWRAAGLPTHLAGDEVRTACRDILQGAGFITSRHWPLESEKSIAPDSRATFRPVGALRQIRRPRDREGSTTSSSVFFVGNSSEVFRIACSLASGDLSIHLDTLAVSFLAGYPPPGGVNR